MRWSAWRDIGALVLLVGAGQLAGLPAAAQSISTAAQLAFGALIAGGGGAVVVAPGGGRSRVGGVMLVGQGAQGAAAQFIITAAANTSYSVTLPADNTVWLRHENGQAMAVSGFSCSPGVAGTMPMAGTQLLSVGATLAVGSGPPAGVYTGSFTVTLNHQ